MARSKRRGTIVPLDPEPGCRRWLVRISGGRELTTDGAPVLTPTGRPKYTRTSQVVHGPKREAEALLTQLLGDRDQGLPTIRGGHQRLGEWLETSLTEAVELAPQTIQRNRAAFKQLPAALRARPLRDLAPGHLQALYAELLAAGKAPGTIAYLHRALSSRLRRAVDQHLIGRNPLVGVTLPRPVHVERQTLTADQVGQLVAATAEHRLGALWAVLALGGLRPEEALALRWDDYDGGRLRVRRALVWLPKGAPTFEPTKGKRARVVSLPPVAQRALQRHRAIQAQEKLAAGTAYQAGGLVFASELGRPRRWQAVARVLVATLQTLGLPPLRPYDLRHTCATLLLAAGVPAKVVAERLGHASITMTLEVYAHVTESMQADADARLEAAVAPSVRQRFGNAG